VLFHVVSVELEAQTLAREA